MHDLERLALQQRVAGRVVADLDQQPSPAEAEPERQSRKSLGQVRREAQDPIVVAHPSESRDCADPCPGERSYVVAKSRIPEKYSNVETSGLEFDVESGSNTIDIPLSSK